MNEQRAQQIRARISFAQRERRDRCSRCYVPTVDEDDLADLLDERDRLLAVVKAAEDYSEHTANMSVVTYDLAANAWHRLTEAVRAYRAATTREAGQ